jgi:hypothetical protein
MLVLTRTSLTAPRRAAKLSEEEFEGHVQEAKKAAARSVEKPVRAGAATGRRRLLILTGIRVEAEVFLLSAPRKSPSNWALAGRGVSSAGGQPVTGRAGWVLGPRTGWNVITRPRERPGRGASRPEDPNATALPVFRAVGDQ